MVVSGTSGGTRPLDSRPASARSWSGLGGIRRLGQRLARFAVAHRLLGLAALAVVVGVHFRIQYGLVLHHPRHFAGSDAGDLVALATRFLDSPTTQKIGDTIWPPGAASLLAPLLALDASLGIAASVQVAVSVLTFLLVGHMAYRLAGPRTGVVALVFASLHFGFIHYTGFFLSEQWFQFAMTLGLWVALVALGRTPTCDGSGARHPRLKSIAGGLAVGACFGFAASVRPNALPVAMVVGVVLAVQALVVRARLRLYALGGALVSWLAVLAPLAARCTKLSGGFCPVSNNFLMNVALGQAGAVSGLEFRAPGHPELNTGWVPPALLHHGYSGTHEVPLSIYDSRGLFSWVLGRWRDEPGACLVRAIGNVFDLSRFEYWPADFGRVDERLATVAAQSFLVLVALPGMFALVALVRRAIRERSLPPPVLVLIATVGTTLVMAAFSLGEARYRMPFDGILIVLAAALYTSNLGALLSPPDVGRGARFGLAAAGVVAGLLALVVSLVSHPAIGASSRLGRAVHLPGSKGVERRRASELATVRWNGTAWDAPGTYKFWCPSSCRALELDWPAPEHAKAVELSVDNNDAYRIAFFRGDRELARVDLKPRSASGLRVERVTVPPAADAGFDRVGVLPLYGDGRYALGHFRLIP
jgi:hypothetical protein